MNPLMSEVVIRIAVDRAGQFLIPSRGPPLAPNVIASAPPGGLGGRGSPRHLHNGARNR
jgi:hypothetical protein